MAFLVATPELEIAAALLSFQLLGVEVALDMVGVWLDTAFGGDRHQRRLDLIESLCRTPAGEPGK
jgi:ribose 5-phosphate isomerase RpiB